MWLPSGCWLNHLARMLYTSPGLFQSGGPANQLGCRLSRYAHIPHPGGDGSWSVHASTARSSSRARPSTCTDSARLLQRGMSQVCLVIVIRPAPHAGERTSVSSVVPRIHAPCPSVLSWQWVGSAARRLPSTPTRLPVDSACLRRRVCFPATPA